MADAPLPKPCRRKLLFDTILARSPRKKLPQPDYSIPEDASEIEPKPWVAIELSNYPPALSRDEIHAIFSGALISPEFVLPTSAKFVHPFRMIIWIAGTHEAQRVVNEVDGTMIQGRNVCVKIVDDATYEEREYVTRDATDELIIAIKNVARLYYPQHKAKILEVRNHVQGTNHYAFLQCSLTQIMSSNIRADWEFIAAGTAEVLNDNNVDGSLAALKDLLATVEDQGAAMRVWEGWEGSRDMDHENDADEPPVKFDDQEQGWKFDLYTAGTAI